MAASVVRQHGDPEFLRLKEVDLPEELNEHELLIEVHASSVNHVDCRLRQGVAEKEGVLSVPAVLGIDFSGIVRKVGSKVERFKIGESVFGIQQVARIIAGRNGTYAEWCVVHEDDAATKPKSLTFEQAAVVPMAGLTAWTALIQGGLDQREGKKVVIIGGCGGVGSFATQFAKRYYRAFVVVCCASKHVDLAKKIGADEVIEYSKGDWKGSCAKYREFDLVLDCVGLDEYWEVFGREVLGSDGKYIALNALRHSLQDSVKKLNRDMDEEIEEEDEDEEDEEEYSFERLATERMIAAKSRVLNIGGGIFSGFRLFQFKDVKLSSLQEIGELLEDGTVKCIIQEIYDLTDMDRAHETLETFHTGGKLCVRI
ncbi:hypothetical protein GUITHDRAFT_85209, partial [Guillardia theta CCMP2712]